MKIYFVFGFITFLLFGCMQSSNENLSDITKIKVKSIVFDKKTSKGFVMCTDYDFNTLESCYYKIDNDQYVKLHSYIFDGDGSLNEFYRYLPMGPLTYNLQDLQEDKIFAQSYDCFIQKVQVYPDFIVDNKDTIADYKIIKKYNVILAEKSNFKHDTLHERFMVIYEY